MLMQRQPFLLNYFQTLCIGPTWESNPGHPARNWGCNSRHISETTRHPTIRIKKYVSTKRNSPIFRHILDSAKSAFSLEIKDLLITKTDSEFKVQVQRLNTIFSL